MAVRSSPMKSYVSSLDFLCIRLYKKPDGRDWYIQFQNMEGSEYKELSKKLNLSRYRLIRFFQLRTIKKLMK